MNKITTASLFFLAAGILTSVSILSAYQVLFTIAVAWFTWVAFKEKNLKLPLSAYWLLGFAVIALITTTLNLDIIPKPSKNFGRIKYFIYGIAGIYVFRYWSKSATDKVKSVLTSTLFLSIIVSSLYVVFTFMTREKSYVLTEKMRWGYGTAMILLLILSGLLHRIKIEKWFNWKVALPTFILGFIAMYLTYTRGALLGFICGLPFVIYFYRQKIGLIIGSLSLVIVLIFGGFYLFGSGGSSSHMLASKNNGADVIRRSQWESAWIATKERPLLGWGLSNFHTQLKRIKTDYDLPAKEYDDAHAHNLFLEISSGTGLIGLFFFLGWLISWALESFKSKGLIRAIVVPFGVAFVVSSQFEVTFDANNASLIMTLYALSSAFPSKQDSSALS